LDGFFVLKYGKRLLKCVDYLAAPTYLEEYRNYIPKVPKIKKLFQLLLEGRVLKTQTNKHKDKTKINILFRTFKEFYKILYFFLENSKVF
jgi:hypothetical protein